MRHYNEKAYVILAQCADGTYIGVNGIKGELDRVYLHKPNSCVNYVNESKRLKHQAKFDLRIKKRKGFSVETIADKKVDAFTNPKSDYQWMWFYLRELIKGYNETNYLNHCNWKAYRLNSKHCPVKIDMTMRRKMYEKKIKYDNVEFFNPKFTLK